MAISKFTDHGKLKEIEETVRRTCQGKKFSDIVDDNNLQYVDLVMEGGGMLGIALVGYIHILEKAGIRFLGIGGTSAGSILALLLAALGTPAEEKGTKLLQELAAKNFHDFVDGDADARDFIQSWVEGAGKFNLAFKAAWVIGDIQKHLGLNPGVEFTRWVEGILRREGVETCAKLRARMETIPPGLRVQDGEFLDTPEKAGCRLAIIAADVSTETKVTFPEMACLYWENPDRISPALFVRASMSIPYFFQPFRIHQLPRGMDIEKKWRDLAGFIAADEGGVPEDALFIDGGIMSNFPIDVFHDPHQVPIAPTFGVKLELDKRRKEISGPLGLFGAIFNAARHTLDYDFLHRNPDYQKLVTWIPAKGCNWLDFDMPEEKKIGLFLEGAECAAGFLDRFDWREYKKIREGTKLKW
ncbi:MAG: patatin-like phospholipase family protein [Thermodesulfobacteriota bacterium]